MLTMPKYLRTPDQIKSLLHEYEDNSLKIKRMLETEEDLKTRAVLQELLAENDQAKKRLERFLDDNPNIFK